MIGYKGFDEELKCRGFQYEVGKIYFEERAECCKQGFHFCERLTDVFTYYPISFSRFCEVQASGRLDIKGDKIAATEIEIIRELTLEEIIEICIKEAKNEKTNNLISTNENSFSTSLNIKKYSIFGNIGNSSTSINKGYRSISAEIGCGSTSINTGDYSITAGTEVFSTSITTGDYSIAVNTGNSSIASTTGKKSIAINVGNEGKVKGGIGSWLILANKKYGKITSIRTFLVDGKKIKANTFYTLIKGKITEVK